MFQEIKQIESKSHTSLVRLLVHIWTENPAGTEILTLVGTKPNFGRSLLGSRDRSNLYVITGVCHNRVELWSIWSIGTEYFFILTKFIITEFHCMFFPLSFPYLFVSFLLSLSFVFLSLSLFFYVFRSLSSTSDSSRYKFSEMVMKFCIFTGKMLLTATNQSLLCQYLTLYSIT